MYSFQVITIKLEYKNILVSHNILLSYFENIYLNDKNVLK